MTNTVTNAVSHASPSRPVPYRDVTAQVPVFLPDSDPALRSDRLSRRIAAEQVRRMDELSLIGYRTSFDPATRQVVEMSLRIVARTALEVILRG